MLHLLPSKGFPYEVPLIGEVEKLFTTYGFISTYDGHRFFFHFGTCASKPEVLKIGDIVEFVLGEDVKTHRLHAQRVRKIISQNVTTITPPSAAAILSSLPPAAVLFSAQTLLTVTAAGLVPLPYPIAAAQMALKNKIAFSSPCSSSTTTAPMPILKFTSAPISGSVGQKITEECPPKRMPLRQIPMMQQQGNCQRQWDGQNGPSWDGVLFKPFAVGGPSAGEASNGSSKDMAMAFERARDAWYSVKK